MDSGDSPIGDDTLADALAASLANATGAIPVIYQLDDVRPSVPEGVPVEQLPAVPVGARILPADESGSYPGTPPAPFDASQMPSPTSAAVPADLPPPPGEAAPQAEQPLEPGPEPGPAPFSVPTPVPTPESVVSDEHSAEEYLPGAPEVVLPEAPTVDLPPVHQPAAMSEVPPPYVPFATPPIVDDPLPRFDEVPFYDRPQEVEEEFPPPTPPLLPPPTGPAGSAPPPVYELDADEAPFDRAAALAASGAPAGKPWVPERTSLRDEELAALMESGADHPGGTLGMMEELERQMKLREDESREFQEWQESMLEVGTPEALAAVEQVAPAFSDIMQPPTTSIPVAAPAPTADAPFSDAPPPPFPAPPPPAAAQSSSSAPPPASVVEPALPDAWDMPSGNVIPDSEVDAGPPIFIEPTPVGPEPLVEPAPFDNQPFVDRVFTGSIPVVTGSVAIPPQLLDVETDDDDDPVDPTDQVPTNFDDLLGAHPGTAPIDPILSPRIPEDEVVLGESQELERPRAFAVEKAALEPTPEEQRVGRAARMFWMWFAANSSIVSLAFGAMLFSLGVSLRQAIVGVLAGVAISFLPLGLGTLAGKRSSQPTMVVSRAPFGVLGNVIPTIVALVSRVFWGAAMLWLLAAGTSAILTGAELNAGMSPEQLTLIALGGGLVIAGVVAVFGYGLIAKFQLVVSIIAGVLIVGFIVLTYQYVDLATALTHADGSWLRVGTVAVLVFSFVGLLWANSSSDLARYQRPGASGAGSMLWTTFGTAVPTFLLISYGALLAASNSEVAAGLLSNPLDSLGRLLPVWYPVPLIAATALSLVSGIVVSLYSGGFAFKSLGMSASRPITVVIVAVLVGAVSFMLTVAGGDMTTLFRDLATTLAVPVAAWAGIFAADTMIRNRRYHSQSLLAAGGIYPTVNWVNLLGMLVVTAIGFGLTTATLGWLGWQGYVFTLVGIPLDGELAATDLGVFVALLLGLLVPIVSGVSTVRRQEAAVPAQN